MNAEQFLDKTTDPEIKILASMVFSREGDNNESVKRAQMLQDLKQRMETDIVHFFYRKTATSSANIWGRPTRRPLRPNRYGPSLISTSVGVTGARSDRSLLTGSTWNTPYEKLNSRYP